MTSTTQSACHARHGPAATGMGQLLQIVRRLPVAYRTYGERRALLALSDHTLKDIGLSRADAYREASRPWWQVPDNR
ncbi:MAG: DUF1127 domain-containing protein [Hyphomicrobiaceae bacterium]|nr:DUF1127 domain-containing protein [Hyphomicrobiaceae bacterium]